MKKILINFILVCLLFLGISLTVNAISKEELSTKLSDGVTISINGSSQDMIIDTNNVFSTVYDNIYNSTLDNIINITLNNDNSYKLSVSSDTVANLNSENVLSYNGEGNLSLSSSFESKKVKIILDLSKFDYENETNAKLYLLEHVEVIDKDSLNNAINNKIPSIKLTNNIDISDTLTFNYTAYLDLNGKILNYDKSNGKRSVIKVTTDGNLTINDSDKTASTFFNADNLLWVKYEVGQTCEKKVEVLGGCILGGTGTLTYSSSFEICMGGGIYNDGIVNFNSGNIIGCEVKVINSGYSLKMKGGGVYNNGTFYMNGGSIQGCFGDNAMTCATTLYNDNKFIMSGGLIDGCDVVNSGITKSEFIYNNKDFIISGSAKITNQYNSSIQSTFDNYKSNLYANGGTIDVDVKNIEGTITTDNSIISKDNMTVFNGDINNDNGTINSGIYNSAISNTDESTIKIYKVEFIIETGYKDINIDSYTIAGENILISSPDGVSLDWYQNSDFEGEPWDFANDKVNSNLTLYGKKIEKLVSTEQELNEAAKIDYVHIILNDDITLSDSLTLANATFTTIFLDLNGNVLKYENDTEKNPVIFNAFNSNLYIIDSNPNKEHKFDATNDVWVLVSDDAKGDNIKTIKGGIITGGTGNNELINSYLFGSQFITVYEQVGGGILNHENLYMLGGTIVGCYSNCAVYSTYSTKNLVIQNATITGCEGYGVRLRSTNLTLEDNAHIYNGIYSSFSTSKIYANGGDVYGNIKTQDYITITRSPNITKATNFYGEIESNSYLTLSAGVYFNKIKTVTFGANKYLVSFISDNICIQEAIVVDDTVIDEIATPTKEGFIFKGWYTEDNKKYDFSNAISSDLKLIAKWEIDTEHLQQLQTDLNNAKLALQDAIDEKADSSYVESKVLELQNKINTLDSIKNNYISADVTLKNELINEINSAKDALNSVITELQTDLNNAKLALQDAIDEKADSSYVESKVLELQNKINTLDSIKNNYISADVTLKNELINEINSANSTLNNAIEELKNNLNQTKQDLQDAIYTKADESYVNVRFNQFYNQIKALESIKDNYKDADIVLKEDLLNEINSAKNVLNNLIFDLQDDLNNTKQDLQDAIDTKADSSYVESKVLDLQNKINTLDNIKNNYKDADETLKSELINEIDSAKDTLNNLIFDLKDELNNAKLALQDAIDTKADSSYVESKVLELQNKINTLDNIKNNYKDADEVLKNEIDSAKDALNSAVTEFKTELNNAKLALQDAIDIKADSSYVESKVLELQNKINTLESIKNNYKDDDSVIKNELLAEISNAKSSLESVINSIKDDLDKAKEELQNAINNGSNLSEKIEVLNNKLSLFETAYKASDNTNQDLLNKNINEVKELLEEAINSLTERVEVTENRVDELNDKLTSIIIILSSVFTILDGGMIAVALIWKRRKGL